MKSKTDKPLITFALITYNQECYIREALEGAFSQTYSPLEIIISDDCSSDKTFEIIQEEIAKYNGPHYTRLNRNSINLGIGGHINFLMQISEGDLIVAAAGDDISMPKRVEVIYQTWEASGRIAKSIFSKDIIINESGQIQGFRRIPSFKKEDFKPEQIINNNFALFGASHAWSREVFDIFGQMLTPLTSEDMVIPFRSALIGEIHYIDEPLIMYRRHRNNIWQNLNEIQNIKISLMWQKALSMDRTTICKNWLADLSKINERSYEIENLKKIVTRRLSSLDQNVALFNASVPKRVAILANTLIRGTNIRELLQRIGLFLFPRFYYKYLNLKNKLKPRREEKIFLISNT